MQHKTCVRVCVCKRERERPVFLLSLRVASFRVRVRHGTKDIRMDWFVCACERVYVQFGAPFEPWLYPQAALKKSTPPHSAATICAPSCPFQPARATQATIAEPRPTTAEPYVPCRIHAVRSVLVEPFAATGVPFSQCRPCPVCGVS